MPRLQQLAAELGYQVPAVASFSTATTSWALRVGAAATAVVDADCRARSPQPVPARRRRDAGGTASAALTMTALALKAADALIAQARLIIDNSGPASARYSSFRAAAAAGLVGPPMRRIKRPLRYARGYLATAADCGATLAPGSHPSPAGLRSAPLGTIYSTNITPSADFGMGATPTEFSRALRRGIRRDGANLYPAMPYILCQVHRRGRMRSISTSRRR